MLRDLETIQASCMVVLPVKDRDGDVVEGQFRLADAPNAIKATELMGKVWGVFTEREEDGTPTAARPVQVIVMGGERVRFT